MVVAADPTASPQDLVLSGDLLFQIPPNNGCPSVSGTAIRCHSCAQPGTLFSFLCRLFLWNKPVCFLFEWGTLLERGRSCISSVFGAFSLK